ncbi:MAG: type 1 glutamine amidotransferase domain-containing protein [Pseudomonadota bacterium]
MQKVLFVLTSHTELGDTGNPTGFFYEELAAPYYAMMDAGHDVTIASIKGGKVEHDPSSLEHDPSDRAASVQRFLNDASALAKLHNTLPVHRINAFGFDAIFLPGGHGTMWDFPESDALAEAVGDIHEKGGIVGAVCHGPAGLVNAKRADGEPLVKGQRVAGFTDREEMAVELTGVVPFLLETRLRNLDASFEGAENFTPQAVRDNRLITGQNPQSSEAVAQLMVAALSDRATKKAA